MPPYNNGGHSFSNSNSFTTNGKLLEAQLNKMTLMETNAPLSSDVVLREYPDNVPIEDFVSEVAMAYNRGLDKAGEWLGKLKYEDIDTIGDLRKLQEEDWVRLGLTVFASRALKNAMIGKEAKSSSSKTNSLLLSSLSPRVTGRVSQTTTDDSSN